MSHWTAAALTAFGIGVGLMLPMLVGKGRRDLKQYVADYASQQQINREFAALTAPLEREVR